MNALIFCHFSDLIPQANEIAEKFNFILNPDPKELNISNIIHIKPPIPILHLTTEGLMLQPENMKPWTIDFLSGAKDYRRKHGGSETLAKACGIKKNQVPLTILDLTAGFAKDAFVLACLGANVILVERHPVIAALLEDALKRFYLDSEACENINLTLYYNDAKHFLTNQLQSQEILVNINSSVIDIPDIIYIDPMHPERKKSASIKKDMQILQQWIPPETHPEHLLELALNYAKKRVVLKWPRTSPPIKNHRPAFIYEKNTVRFEVYLPFNHN